MYSRLYMATLLFIGFWSFAGTIKTIKIEIIQESIDHHTFIHKMEDINGIYKEQWLVDNSPVDREEYKKHKIEARTQEIEREEDQRRARRRKIFQADMRARAALQKKLLAHMIDRVEHQRAHLSNPHLMPYFIYKSTTVSHKEQLDQLEQKLDRAEELVDDPESTYNQLHESYVYLEEIVSRLQQFFYDALENALELCDDPRLLKEFLMLLNNKHEEYE